MIKQIFVKAKPNVKKESMEIIDESHFVVSVKKPSKEGRANEAVRKILAEYFDVAVSWVNLVSGFSSRQKKFEIR